MNSVGYSLELERLEKDYIILTENNLLLNEYCLCFVITYNNTERKYERSLHAHGIYQGITEFNIIGKHHLFIEIISSKIYITPVNNKTLIYSKPRNRN